jgi:hypothetical protein
MGLSSAAFTANPDELATLAILERIELPILPRKVVETTPFN